MSSGSERAQDEAPRRRPGVRADINVTPLVDVVLVLLIIFMVVTPQMEAGASVELPPARNPDAAAPGALQALTVSLTREGQLFLEKEPLARSALVPRLEASHRERPEARLVLKADRQVPYAEVRSLFRTCQQVGFPGISLQVIAQDTPQP